MHGRIVGAIAIIGAGVAAIGGCVTETEDSCHLATDQISIVATVLDAGGTLRAEIDFEEGDRSGLGTPLTLCSDDRLRINGTEAVETVRAERVVYGVTFDADAERRIVFDLERTGMGDRVTFEATLRAAFQIAEPLENQSVPRAQDLCVRWAPAEMDPEATMRIELGEDVGMGMCIFTADGEHDYKRYGGIEVLDDGEWVVPGGSVMLVPEDASGTDGASAAATDGATATDSAGATDSVGATGAVTDSAGATDSGATDASGATCGAGGSGATGPSASDPGTCAASYTLRRIAPADYPAAFGRGGYVETIVERSVSVWSIP
jgi:hypothetical protein